ncbi:something about silencing protein 10-like [Dorcoceras hygrometricum]|uniref:Something about silencing protein 10-like n=1 Tax=Dorcoceras hygrometricum TaxID=472368 RepID=A0A2Z7CTB4_9LAMI|nr:something about silencing protein 10-like [Dorcoceras hygrometricum]
MGRKGGKYKRKESCGPAKKKAIPFNSDDGDMMNDEIDAFHKQKDVLPMLLDEDMDESDEDGEQSVFDIKDEEDEDEDEDAEIDDLPSKGFVAKLQRTKKNLRDIFGEVEDAISDDAPEEEQERIIWGGKKDGYGADVSNEPLSSDDEDAAEEEAEVLKLQSEKAKALSMEDYGLEDTGQDAEATFKDILDQGETASRPFDQVNKDEAGLMYEIVKKDLNALTKEEQMDVVYSSAPELVGLLSELKDSLEQLENKINPLVNKIREQESVKKGVMHYIEVKQLLLQSFCQAITFYLLLKTEGQPVRDHPVVSRLVEIKSLLDKMKELDENLPSNLEDIMNKHVNHVAVLNLVEETGAKEAGSLNKAVITSKMSSVKHAMVDAEEKSALTELNTTRSSKNIELQQKRQDIQVGVESLEMLRVRAALEMKLKQKGVLSSSKNVRRTEHLEPVISGDDDVPKRDDIGERRRKYELRVLAGAGVTSADNLEVVTGNFSSDRVAEVDGESDPDPDLEYYKQVEQQHAAKLAAKSIKYSSRPPKFCILTNQYLNRTLEVSSLPDDTVDGKRLITHQMEKNRGLTRARKKLIKNPRKKYKLKHQKAEVCRKGQVREVRKPTGPYGGEATGSRTPQNPPPMLNTLSSVSVRESRIQYLCDPQWFRDTASRGPTTIVAPESQFRTFPLDHGKSV